MVHAPLVWSNDFADNLVFLEYWHGAFQDSIWSYLFANYFGQLVSVDSVNVVDIELEHVLLAPVAQLVLLHRKAHRTDRLLQVLVLVVEQGANGDGEPAAGGGQDAGQGGQLQGHSG